jgi:hypothetical protein
MLHLYVMFNLYTCQKLVVTFKIISIPTGHDLNYFNTFSIFFYNHCIESQDFLGFLRFWNKVWGLNIFQTKWFLCRALGYQ